MIKSLTKASRLGPIDPNFGSLFPVKSGQSNAMYSHTLHAFRTTKITNTSAHMPSSVQTNSIKGVDQTLTPWRE